MTPVDIMVVGSLNVDIVAEVDHVPKAGETVKARAAQFYVGGKGGNQAVAAARQGARVRMIGAVGTDLFGPSVRAALAGSGVEIEGVISKEGPTGLAMIAVESDGQNRIIVCEGANAELSPVDVESALDRSPFPPGAAMLVQNEIPRETVARAIHRAHQLGWRVVWNVAPVDPISKGLLAEDDVIVVNETEASALTGLEVTDGRTVREAAKRLLDEGPGLAVVTLGDHGSFALSRAFGEMRIPAFAVDVVDTTAAGDTYIGTFAARWDGVRSPEEALRWAAAASALCVSRRGAQDSIPTGEETAAFLRECE